MTTPQDLVLKYGLPIIGGPVLDTRYKMSSGDWYVQTPDGWFYCRTQNVKSENWKWVPSAYGPAD